jgi:salicylate hydroxylase
VVGCEERSSAVSLKFQDGTTADFDLVVGADGIKSVIRREFITASLPHEIDRIAPVFSGTKAYRALIPQEILEQRSSNHRALRTPLSVSLFPYLYATLAAAHSTVLVVLWKK